MLEAALHIAGYVAMVGLYMAKMFFLALLVFAITK